VREDLRRAALLAKGGRPQLRAAPEYCREGDELVVWKLERTMAGLEAARAQGLSQEHLE
jgi:DNA invertase Pin-like site-specific DNA recombinase